MLPHIHPLMFVLRSLTTHGKIFFVTVQPWEQYNQGKYMAPMKKAAWRHYSSQALDKDLQYHAESMSLRNLSLLYLKRHTFYTVKPLQ